MEEKKRRTTIPIKSIPEIVEWLINNCTHDELSFMAQLASNRKSFAMLKSIFTRLTDYNIYEVFYTKFSNSEELSLFRASKRGEVAGLKAFSMACQSAVEIIKKKGGEVDA